MFQLDMHGAEELEIYLKDEVTKYQEGRDTLPKKVVEAGYREAKRRYAGGFTDGNLLPSISMGTWGRGDWYLEASGDDLAYLEYGTGIVGASYPYPEPIDWTYDSKNHGNKGWLYPPKNGDKRLIWSRGIRGRRGLFHAAQKMKEALSIYLIRW